MAAYPSSRSMPEACARVAVRVPPVLATMHLTWGLGFLRGTREE